MVNKKDTLLKSLVLGNGNILLTLDQCGQVRDFYFPYVGLENHIGGHFSHRVGVYVDGVMSWLTDPDWDIKINCDPTTFAGKILASNKRLGIELKFTDIVYNERNIFIRRIIVSNLADQARDIKIFFYQQFELYESHTAHTAYYDPEHKVIIHYRNKRVFLIGGQLEGHHLNDFTTGIFASEGKEGSFVDATDGELTKNPIEHGQADSVISFSASFRPKEEKFLYYWVTVGHSINEVIELNDYVIHKGAGYLLQSTQDFWHAWVNRQNFSFYGLSPEVVAMFNQSLFYVRAHADMGGGIIASGDSSMLHKGKDTYAYVWPRDAAYACLALDRVGDFNVTQRFYQFANEVVTPEGYFMHKYSPDKSLGSSWHGRLYNGQLQLPIQEDETAIILVVLWEHYKLSKDLEFIESVYNPLIKKAADFLVLYRADQKYLPKASFGLWEEKFGVHTYTTCAVYGGLIAAANFSRLLGKTKSEQRYIRAAQEIKESLLAHLYNADKKIFYKMISESETGEMIIDETPDISSFYGLFTFGLLDPNDIKVKEMAEKIKTQLAPDKTTPGLCRYYGDQYYRRDDNNLCNPWFVATFWYAEWLVAKAKNEKDLEAVKDILTWAVKHAQTSGILSEQLDGETSEPLSATPLVWSHAGFINVVIKYLDKLEEFGICKACNPVY